MVPELNRSDSTATRLASTSIVQQRLHTLWATGRCSVYNLDSVQSDHCGGEDDEMTIRTSQMPLGHPSEPPCESFDSRQRHPLIIVLPSPISQVGVPLHRSDAELLEEFKRLVKQWHVQRGVSSSITQGALCPAYQSIIGMGRPAVPLLLRQLKSERDDPDQWFWALNAITGCQPVPEADLGNFVRMAGHWLSWGRRNGYDL